MNALVVFSRFVVSVFLAAAVWPSRVAAVPTISTDDFSDATHWPVVLATPNAALAVGDNRLYFTCPAMADEESAVAFWNAPALPANRDWSIRCRAHVTAFPLLAGPTQWITLSFGFAKNGGADGTSIGIEFCRDQSSASSGGFAVSADNRVNGANFPDTFSTAAASPDVGLRLDYAATTRVLTYYLDADGAGSASGWVRVGTVDLAQGASNLNLTATDTFTVYLREAAANVAVTTGMTYFSGFEAVLDPEAASFAGWAADLFTPAQLADPAVSGTNADPGGTGAANLLRYAFSLPAPGTPLTGPVAPVTLVPDGGANYLSVAIHRKSYDSTLRYYVEVSADCVNWTTITTLVAGDPRDVVVRDSVPTSAAARRFLRVRVAVVP